MSITKFDGTAPISFAPGTLLGYRKDGRPFYLIAGGAPKDDEEFDSNMGDGEDDKEDDEDVEDEEEDDDDKEDEDKEDDKSKVKEDPKKSAQEQEIERLKQRLAKTRRESAARRKKLEEVNRNNDADAKKDGDDKESAVREAKQSGYTEAETKYKGMLHAVAGRVALMEAGVKPAKAKRALKLIDFDDVEIDDEGELIGIEDAIDDLKEEWPELFVPEKDEDDEPVVTKTRVKSNHVNGANRKTGGVKKPKTATEVALERLTGARR